jgi:hypothetical protein
VKANQANQFKINVKPAALRLAYRYMFVFQAGFVLFITFKCTLFELSTYKSDKIPNLFEKLDNS